MSGSHLRLRRQRGRRRPPPAARPGVRAVDRRVPGGRARRRGSPWPSTSAAGPASTTRLLADVFGAAPHRRARALTELRRPGPPRDRARQPAVRASRGRSSSSSTTSPRVPFPVGRPDVRVRPLPAGPPRRSRGPGRALDRRRSAPADGSWSRRSCRSTPTIPVLGRYVELVTALSVANGTDLLVGRRLGAAGLDRSRRSVVHDDTATIAPAPDAVARLFVMNLGVWRHGAWARATLDPTELDELAGALRALVDAPPPTGAIVWRHRQLGLRAVLSQPRSAQNATDAARERVGRLPLHEVSAVAEQERADVVVEDDRGHAGRSRGRSRGRTDRRG